MLPTSNKPPTGALAACVLFTLLSLLSWSTGEYPTSELAFDGVCMMWEEVGVFGVGVGGCSVLGVTYLLRRQGLLVCWSTPCAPHPLSLLPPPLSLSPCVSPPLQPACTPDRQTDAICRASPALGLYHSPQTAHCLHTGCKFRLPLSL